MWAYPEQLWEFAWYTQENMKRSRRQSYRSRTCQSERCMAAAKTSLNPV